MVWCGAVGFKLEIVLFSPVIIDLLEQSSHSAPLKDAAHNKALMNRTVHAFITLK
jgi:hypothetical protein